MKRWYFLNQKLHIFWLPRPGPLNLSDVAWYFFVKNLVIRHVFFCLLGFSGDSKKHISESQFLKEVCVLYKVYTKTLKPYMQDLKGAMEVVISLREEVRGIGEQGPVDLG